MPENPSTDTAVLEDQQSKPEPKPDAEATQISVLDSSPPDQKEKPVVLLGNPSRPLGPETALENCYDKMEVRQSPLEGFGVFATQLIPAGTVLEEIPFVLWPRFTQMSDKLFNALKEENWVSKDELHYEQVRSMFDFKHPSKYYFKWFPPNVPKEGGESIQYQVLPLGYGPIYNSANGRNNASWEVLGKTFVFRATRDIHPGDEIFTFYGYMVSETGDTFNTPDVFGMGLELVPKVNPADGLEVRLTNIRFSSPENQAERLKEEGTQKFINALRLSNGSVKLNKISAMDGNQEVHPFEFPPDFSLSWHFMKLREFKFTRFKMVKFYISYVDVSKPKKEITEDILFVNHNG